MSCVPKVAMIYHVFSYELCVAKGFSREPQIRFHRNMESVRVSYVMFNIMFNFIFVFLLAFYVYVKLNSFISVHNTVQSDYTKGPQRHDDKHTIENMLGQVHRVIKKKRNAMDDNILAADEILKNFGNFENL